VPEIEVQRLKLGLPAPQPQQIGAHRHQAPSPPARHSGAGSALAAGLDGLRMKAR
jgi:hypothetical protein